MQFQNDEMNPKWLNGDIVIWCDSILLGQTCNTKLFLYLYKHQENISRSNISYSHAMKNQLVSLSGEVIQLCRANWKQQKTLNRVDNFLEQM